MKYIAFTGHRPKDLPANARSDMFFALDTLGMQSRTDLHFIVGGAQGVDEYAAGYAILNNIPFTLILPFAINLMPTPLHHAQAAADVITLGGDKYDVTMYQRRNEAMVDQAGIVLAVWSGKKIGGTANCIRYALRRNKPVYNLMPFDGRLRQIRSM